MIDPKYVLKSSRSALREMRMRKLNEEANVRKKWHQLDEERIEARATALLIEWLEVYGEELLVLLSEPPSEEVPQVEGKPALKTVSFEFWRSERRHARRRAL